MALVLYPVEDGDEDKYEIFDVTSDTPWTPRHYMHNEQAYQVSTPSTSTSIVQDIPFVSTKTFFLTLLTMNFLLMVSQPNYNWTLEPP
jgi:hypothetical protein